MPLRCIRCLLALLLLPLALSCDRQRPLADIAEDLPLVRTDLEIANNSITDSLQNVNCPKPKHKLQDCTSGNAILQDLIDTLLTLACKMEHSGVQDTDRVIDSVIHSINCSCADRPTRAPGVRSRRRKRTTTPATRTRKVGKKKRCRAKTLLAAMAECIKMLNSNMDS